MLDAELYITCLDLTGRRVVVVGSGPMADEKVTGLRACGAEVQHVSQEDYSHLVLDNAYLVIAATSDGSLDRAIFEEAERRSMLVNVADVPDLCNFILPAVARCGPLAVAISTSGASPALAKRMKAEAAEMFDDAYARLAEILDDLRPWAKNNLSDYNARRTFFDGIVNATPDPIVLLREGKEEEVIASIERAKAVR